MLTAFSPNSAVGLRNVNPAGVLSVAHMRWDGTEWTVTSADPIEDLEGGIGWNVRGLAGPARDDLWATALVGLDSFHGAPFLAHFDRHFPFVTPQAATVPNRPTRLNPHPSGARTRKKNLAPDPGYMKSFHSAQISAMGRFGLRQM